MSIRILALLSVFLGFGGFSFAEQTAREFDARGQVITVDPVYSQVTIQHGAIKDFSGDGETEFYVTSGDLLKGLSRYDLVDFHIVDQKGDVKIDRIEKTGVAVPKESGVPLGEALDQTLQGAGQVAQVVTSPIAPVSEAIGGATNSTTDAADPKIEDGEIKQKLATF